jgi:hypothetical protein
MYSYEVINNEVYGYVEGQAAACLYQPTWPNGAKFTAKKAAEFGAVWVKSMEDLTAPFNGDSPEEPTRERMVITEPEPAS